MACSGGYMKGVISPLMSWGLDPDCLPFLSASILLFSVCL